MYQVPEPFVSLSKANFEVAAGVVAIALEGSGSIIMANLRALKTMHADGARRLNSMVAANNGGNFTLTGDALPIAWTSPAAATRYFSSICDAATEAHTKVGRLLEDQIVEFNKHLAGDFEKLAESAPAGADALAAAVKSTLSTASLVCDSVSKSVICLAEATRAGSERTTAPAGKNESGAKAEHHRPAHSGARHAA